MTRRLRNLVLTFFSTTWSGVFVALFTTALGIVAAVNLEGGGRVAGFAVAVLGLLVGIGASRHLRLRHKAWRAFPPPGQRVDVGGYRVHVLAEGESNGQPSVVWMPGGHGGGLALDHLHRQLRTTARSILIDRPGTGWSDAGPFPRTTPREVDEVARALEGAGEAGPFVLVGHSFGGLLFSAFARKYPERVAALLLMDATPPDTIIYGPPIPGLAVMKWAPVVQGVLQLFGLDFVAELMNRPPPNAEYERIERVIREQLGDAWEMARAIERGPRAACASAAIFDELTPQVMAAMGWESLAYEGDLDGTLVRLVAPGDMHDFDEVAEMIDGDAPTRGQLDAARLHRFYMRSRERFLTISNRSDRVVAPSGTGHNFLYEAPEFVLEVVSESLRLCAGQDSAAGNAANEVPS